MRTVALGARPSYGLFIQEDLNGNWLSLRLPVLMWHRRGYVMWNDEYETRWWTFVFACRIKAIANRISIDLGAFWS